MAYWLLKTEPDEYSIDDLRRENRGFAVWDGIRNYQARNLLRDQVAIDDEVLIYHSQCKIVGVVGRAVVVRAGYPDPAQFDPDSKYYDPKASADNPRWYCIDVAFNETFPRPLSLAAIKREPALEDMVLLKQGRLSVQPVDPAEWRHILQLADSHAA
ncbi:EVE domain-containing protein [Parahaliea mediterranea]|uniref:EVE domain-containing protein n=1 Tax=Parahaliea mediterranea TaxID=651086 RepID=A0A939IL76_9GAMM|nr:EVE domain-containing protein [Parahaliea mediterranea]MBN7795677.1 EVE domain-containing protein [Parahaliea mediterranea]